MLVFKGSITKITIFHDFWQNYPPKTTPWAPCSRGKSLKTTEDLSSEEESDLCRFMSAMRTLFR